MGNKEAILMPFNEVVTGQWDYATKEAEKKYPDDLQRQVSYREGIFKGYSKALYDSASQNESYVKQEELYLATINEQSISNTALQYKNEDLRKENEELKELIHKYGIGQLQSTIEESDKEIERLKGLLKNTIYERVDVYYNDRKDEFDVPDIQEQAWQQFKTENNL